MGRAVCVQSADLARARRIASKMRAGQVLINYLARWHTKAPFWGLKTIREWPRTSGFRSRRIPAAIAAIATRLNWKLAGDMHPLCEPAREYRIGVVVELQPLSCAPNAAQPTHVMERAKSVKDDSGLPLSTLPITICAPMRTLEPSDAGRGVHGHFETDALVKRYVRHQVRFAHAFHSSQ